MPKELLFVKNKDKRRQGINIQFGINSGKTNFPITILEKIVKRCRERMS